MTRGAPRGAQTAEHRSRARCANRHARQPRFGRAGRLRKPIDSAAIRSNGHRRSDVLPDGNLVERRRASSHGDGHQTAGFDGRLDNLTQQPNFSRKTHHAKTQFSPFVHDKHFHIWAGRIHFDRAARRDSDHRHFGGDSVPVFARARENARRSSCQSNLKQIGLGLMQYTQDYDEYYPRQNMLAAPRGGR